MQGIDTKVGQFAGLIQSCRIDIELVMKNAFDFRNGIACVQHLAALNKRIVNALVGRKHKKIAMIGNFGGKNYQKTMEFSLVQREAIPKVAPGNCNR